MPLRWNKTVTNASCIISIVMLGISVSISSSRKQKRDLAASIQQEFDIDVFQMPWDNKLFGAQKDLNCEIVEKSTKILRNKGQSDKLKNWYTSAVDLISIVALMFRTTHTFYQIVSDYSKKAKKN